jgi:hypothetical protein
MTLDGTVTVPGESQITLSGHGAFNFKAKEGQLSLTFDGLPAQAATTLGGSSMTMTELYKANSVYVGSSVFAGRLPGGARWMRLDLSRVEQAAGIEPGSLGTGQSSDPAALVGYLEHAGVTQNVGHELVRGVETTHYQGTLDMQRAIEAEVGSHTAGQIGKLLSAAGLHSIPVGVWVDAAGRVRRMTMSYTLAPSGQQIGFTLQCEFFDYGATPAVHVPGASEVFDGTQQALAPLGAAG